LTLLADPKVHQLLTLVADPKIQEWLERQGDAKTAEKAPTGSTRETGSSVADSFENRFGSIQLGEQAGESEPSIPMIGTPVFDERYLNSSAGAIHRQIVALARAIPDLPNQFDQAAARDSVAHGKQGRAWALFTLARQLHTQLGSRGHSLGIRLARAYCVRRGCGRTLG
jgi:hypothetical protein